MKINYFNLSKSEQSLILGSASMNLGISPQIIEKDIWICQVLNYLFQLDMLMTFKGGTSLSKGYNLINRFSEDVDITIDFRNFLPDLKHVSRKSNSENKRISKLLKTKLNERILSRIVPYLLLKFKEYNLGSEVEITIDESNQNIWIIYPSVLKKINPYIKDKVLLEFGARNTTDPSTNIQIKTLIEPLIDTIEFPSALVNVLSPIRTFWEKVTLIHVECNRNRISNSVNRLFRHWYDLYSLINSWVFEEAMNDISVFKDVINIKTMFFNAAYINYNDCYTGNLTLIPNMEGIKSLSKDYESMETSGMFSKDPPPFEKIILCLEETSEKINSLMKQKRKKSDK